MTGLGIRLGASKRRERPDGRGLPRSQSGNDWPASLALLWSPLPKGVDASVGAQP